MLVNYIFNPFPVDCDKDLTPKLFKNEAHILKSPFENNVEGNRKVLTKLYIKAALHLLYSNIHYTVQTTNQNKSHF